MGTKASAKALCSSNDAAQDITTTLPGDGYGDCSIKRSRSMTAYIIRRGDAISYEARDGTTVVGNHLQGRERIVPLCQGSR